MATWLLFLQVVFLDRIFKYRMRFYPKLRVPGDILIELVMVFLFLDKQMRWGIAADILCFIFQSQVAIVISLFVLFLAWLSFYLYLYIIHSKN